MIYTKSYTRLDHLRDSINRHIFYKIPILPIKLERLIIKMIGKIEPKYTMYKHFGKDCIHCIEGRH